MGESIFAAAEAAVSILELAQKETTLRKQGREYRGGCPLCGAGTGKGASVFRVRPEKGSFECFACAKFGDVTDLEQELRGGTLVEAARRLAGDGWKAQATVRPALKPEPPKGPTTSEKIAAELWATSRPILGTLAERYLLHRGISPEVVALAAEQLRYHPFAKWAWDDTARDWTKAPAMLAQVVTAAGPTGGVHATYLARDGRGKAALDPAKRMWGLQLDGSGRPGGAWLIGPDAPAGADLVVAEGIETTLSVVTLAAREGRTLRACAALSLNRLQGGLERDAEGCVDLVKIGPDLERAPFTWPVPADAPWGEVLIAVDRDMAPIKLKGRTPRGKVCNFVLDAEARARLCGRLARAAWERAGSRAVRSIAPPLGSDFNNELRRVLAAEGVAA